MSNSYQDLYTWSHSLKVDGGDVICHKDGSISAAVKWDGIQTSLKEQGVIMSMIGSIKEAFHSMAPNYSLCVENHFLRDYQDDVCARYIKYGEDNMVRAKELGMYIRHEMASTIGSLAMDTKIVTVITLERKTSMMAKLMAKREVRLLEKVAKKLLTMVSEYTTYLPGARLLSCDEFEAEIWHAYHRERSNEQSIPPSNPEFPINQRLASKPLMNDGYLTVGDTHTRVMLLLDYPDAPVNWFYGLAATCGVELHVTQILRPMNVDSMVLASTMTTSRNKEVAGLDGAEVEGFKLSEHAENRAMVAADNLHVFKNAYIIKVHSRDIGVLNEVVLALSKMIRDGGGSIAENRPEMMALYWRISQLGQGHKSSFMRQDNTRQVVNMAPVITFSKGEQTYLHMLRLSSDGQAIAFGYDPDEPTHSLCVARTGGGKGIDMCSQVLETYPLGIDYYLIEVGASYKWTVEAFGGPYYHLTPDVVVSPFPMYNLANQDAKVPINLNIAAPTIEVLIPLLSQGHDHMKHHIYSVALQTMQDLYRSNPDADGAPTMGDYHDFVASAIDKYEGVQRDAAKIMIDNLGSFLDGIGSNFRAADSIDFSGGIVGFDFKGLMGSKELAKFLLCFVCLRLKQIAFSSGTQCRICVDELHEFAEIDPELITLLIKQLTRMGRKDAAAFHGITQETMDMDLEGGILNQINNRSFLYTQSGHDDVSKLFGMNEPTLNAWKSYIDPSSKSGPKTYRNGIRMVGDDAYDLHLKFPKSVLAIAHSSPRALEAKNIIGHKTRCVFERLDLFAREMAA